MHPDIVFVGVPENDSPQTVYSRLPPAGIFHSTINERYCFPYCRPPRRRGVSFLAGCLRRAAFFAAKESGKRNRQRGPIPRRSPLETLPDGQGRNPVGFPPLDPLSGERKMGCHNLTQGRPVPWLPLGLRSRGAGVNDMPVHVRAAPDRGTHTSRRGALAREMSHSEKADRAAGTMDKGTRYEYLGAAAICTPAFPWGLRSRGAGVNDMPVACQSRA